MEAKKLMEDLFLDDKLNEECGVFGVYKDGANFDPTRLTYYGLFALQHRGQESAGIDRKSVV